MTVKTANVNVRIDKNVKERAEAILDTLGMSASTFINMTYRQVILHNGIPFDVIIPTRDTMEKSEFDRMMKTGLEQAKAGDSIPYKEAFDSLKEQL